MDLPVNKIVPYKIKREILKEGLEYYFYKLNLVYQ